jgi:anti-sigma B factor antagonist
MSLDERSVDIDQGPLKVLANHVGGVFVMSPVGEVDLATVPLLHVCLSELGSELDDGLVVDLSGVTFLDSTGLAFLLAADKQIRGEGRSFAVYAPPPQVRRLFDISGLTSVLNIVPE